MKVLQEPGNKQLVQKMELDHIADRRLPAAQAAVPRHRGRSAVRARREGALGAPHRPGRRLHVAERARRVRAARPLAGQSHRIDHDHELTRRAEDRGAAAGRDRVRVEGRAAEHRPPAAARARAVRARRELRRAGRRGADRRRVHRPHDAGTPLVGRAAPGGRGQGRRPREGRDADDGHDHDPELLPHVRQAGRHDRHGRDGRDGVLPDLQARGRGHPDEQADGPRGPARPRLQDAPREVQRDRRGDAPAARPRLPGAHRHDERRRVGDAVEDVQPRRAHAQRAQREVPPARGGDRGGRRSAGRGHDRDEHGRPRNRHQTRRRRHRVRSRRR